MAGVAPEPGGHRDGPLWVSVSLKHSDTSSSFQLLDAEWVLAGCSLNEMHRPLFPLQPSVPMGPGNPVPAPGMMPSGAEQTWAVGLTGQGESHLCTMVLDPAGRGSSREKGQPLHRGWSSAGGVEGSGWQRVGEARDLAPPLWRAKAAGRLPAASLCWLRCQCQGQHCLHGPG